MLQASEAMLREIEAALGEETAAREAAELELRRMREELRRYQQGGPEQPA